ncbi:MAG: HupE/UreJ family protein [Pseudomonadota bacterium]
MTEFIAARRAAFVIALTLVFVTVIATQSASAHTDGTLAGGFVTGFTHPILGWDHVAAMVAVGLWGAFLGSPAIWILPVVFPLVMALGAAAGVLGIPLPGVEIGIAGSAVVLGLLILFGARLPLWAAAVIVGVFAVFHGYAHGIELPDATNPIAYGVGFVLATGLLHMLGIAFGLLVRWPAGTMAVRAGGALVSLVGVGFLVGFF